MSEQYKKVAALRYDSQKDESPRVVAKGRGKVADNILQTAKEYGIPVQEDPTLVELLSKLELNRTIPEELYQAVAEVMAFIYKVDRQVKVEATGERKER